MDRLHPRVVRWARSDAVAPKSRWGIAFSGGADSLALLLLVWAHWPEKRSRLIALHFNHRLRGRASAGDLRFCRSVCKDLDVPLHTDSWRRSKRVKSVSESMARAARFDFFETVLKKTKTQCLWLGHQKDDIAESILMRVARGSGSVGLSAPRPVQTISSHRLHVRCLLTLSKAQLVKVLKAEKIVWREDATNSEGTYLRNRMRLRVIPVWQRASLERDVLGGAALSRELLEEDAEALDLWVDRLNPLRGGALDLKVLSGLPRAVTRRALQRWRLTLGEKSGDLSRQGFEALLDAVEEGETTTFSLGRDGFAEIADFRLRYRQKVTKNHTKPSLACQWKGTRVIPQTKPTRTN